MRVVVFGGRDYGWPKKYYVSEDERQYDLETRINPQRQFLSKTLYDLKKQYSYPYDSCGKPEKSYLEIISGMADGADTLAAWFAKAAHLKLHEFPADWDRYKKGAGPIRNQSMIDIGKPELGIAFPGGSGTQDMINRLKFEGIPVKEMKYVLHID